jgi:hypothetical protein
MEWSFVATGLEFAVLCVLDLRRPRDARDILRELTRSFSTGFYVTLHLALGGPEDAPDRPDGVFRQVLQDLVAVGFATRQRVPPTGASAPRADRPGAVDAWLLTAAGAVYRAVPDNDPFSRR